MTFGSTFGRVFSPTFKPKSQAAAASSWWLAGGIDPANCVVAYQPKGAASYAASKVNLANAGTYDAVDGTSYPDWDATNGWIFDGANAEYLYPNGFYPDKTNYDWSMIVRFSNASAAVGTNVLLGINDAYDFFYIYAKTGGNHGFGHGNKFFLPSPNKTSGVLCMAGLECYANGVHEGTIATPTVYNQQLLMGIGATMRANSPLEYYYGYMQAVAIYNATLTSTQVGLLTTAMAAL